MLASTFIAAAIAAGGFVVNGAFAESPQGFRLASSPSYRSGDVCPQRCRVSGPNIGNWSAYPDFKQIRKCKQTMFYGFSLYDPVDDEEIPHRIYACSSFGPDFSTMPASSARIASVSEPVDVNFEIGWWEEGFGLAASGVRSLIKQIRKYVDRGHGATDTPFIMFGQSGQAAIGIYIGQGLLNQGLTESALKTFQDGLFNLNTSTPSLAMQLCRPGYDSTHIFGIMVTSNGTFTQIQDAIKTWNNATCLSFSGSTNVTGQAKFTTPLVLTNGTFANGTITNGTTNSTLLNRRHALLHARANCRTRQVDQGDSCASLATKCGISGADFTKYNPGSGFCANLKPKQHVCCSSGTLPDLKPKPNADGSCRSHKIEMNDNCDNLAAEYTLTRKDIEDFNKKTWGWNGCQLLFKDTVMCLSKGTPPFPAAIANANCGPQKPGTKAPTDGSDIAKLNPCPLNACCNIWGQCGTTKDFCVDTNTGSPGTAKAGTYGCISNCGTEVVKGNGNGAIKIGYFEGYNMGRKCLYQDASQIDTSAYTHIHFGFGTLKPNFEVEVGDALSTYQFGEFARIKNSKRILSFGGWEFSNSPSTYTIFRNGVTAANRLKMATSIANFIKKHNLDGVDIDWEYPGAPDLPDIASGGSKDEGPNYLAFLVILKNLLPGKSISIAAPASYWYLKQFPIKEIGRVVDYIVYMTYDLHGQWDAHNSYSQEGCSTGNCLRSKVNLTETKQSLAMITKAGVPGSKVIVGVTSYGRSFKMAQSGCWGTNCKFTGDRIHSKAAKGVCTDTAGYLADAEIAEIIAKKTRVVTQFVDTGSNSDILVYDNNEWVGYMSAATKKSRAALYAAWGMGGTTDWATDLQKYHTVPKPAVSWALFKQFALSGENPKADWTDFQCTDPLVANTSIDISNSARWNGLKADAAWKYARRIYTETDKRNKVPFLTSVHNNLKLPVKCSGAIDKDCPWSACDKSMDEALSGPEAQLVWNSLRTIHEVYSSFYNAVMYTASLGAFKLDNLQNQFAPVPPEKDDTWDLFLINMLTTGTLLVAAPIFNSLISTTVKQVALNTIKDTTMTLVSQGTTTAKDLMSGDNPTWTPQKQDIFSHYLGNVLKGWIKGASLTLRKLFNGDEDSLDILEEAMADGKLFSLTEPDMEDPDDPDDPDDLTDGVYKAFYGFAIPALWQASRASVFVVDADTDCNANKPLGDYLSEKTMQATGVCYAGRRYYLVHLEGEAFECGEGVCLQRKFSAPPGIDSLNADSQDFHISKDDLVKGAIRTQNENGGGLVDPTDVRKMDPSNIKITAPGFIRLPVCSPERAFQSWDTAPKGHRSSPNYPCDNPPGIDNCGDSSFENQSSGASPKVDDCRQIIKNIEGDGRTEWTTQVALGQRAIARFGSCRFGVEATTGSGNADSRVGGQDVIDIINECISRFGGNGRVGAKGTMKCNGSVNKQGVKWSIY
ncbi:glycosylhydrolase family 18-6 [Colletotrichum kahawae]|uniref:chitinase n=1 Tax=Colletotrichum kahawae TaxID=34407 RepID=A0AAD9YF89_COLKA|nr:glycosylhydrolase family 18-6 [Colletotrichum kahawae]